MKIPNNYSMIYSEDKIQEAVVALGAQVNAWACSVWDETGKDVLALPVLRGGLFFFADLVRQVKVSIEVAPVKTWAYEVGQNAVHKPEVKIDLYAADVKDRAVLVVDDFCDSGRTLKALRSELEVSGAKAIRTVTLVKRLIDNPSYMPDWCGLEYCGDEWLVGYGLEDGERWRNLPSIYTIQSSNRESE